MSIFPYIQNSSDLLQLKYQFDLITAGKLFGVPYIISAILSPLLGLIIDKIGRRALMMAFSSVIFIIAYSASMIMPPCNKCYNEVFTLVLVGLGYSIYCACIWTSIPYVVKPSAVGSAFGMTTALQNTGMVIAPFIVGSIRDKYSSIDHGYYYVNAFFVSVNILGLIFNIILYVLDIYYYNGVLDKVQVSSTP